MSAPASSHRIICGKNTEVVSRFVRKSIDFAPTSPPYANQRRKHYSSVSEEDYPQWTVHWMSSVARVLKPHGSVMIVIRSHIRDGAVSPYVLKTRLALLEAGWHEPDELIWYKPDGIPTGRSDRCRHVHESILWFSRSPKKVFCDPKANGTPSDRIADLKAAPDGNGKGFRKGVIGGKKFLSAYAETKDAQRSRRKSVRLGLIEECPSLKPLRKGIARSTDVLRATVGSCNRAEYNHHVAQHPADLYRQLIRLACPPGGVVLDPFAGSGTTMEAAYLEGRHSISIDCEPSYIDIIRKRHLDLLTN